MSEQICTILPNRRKRDRASAMLAAAPLIDIVERPEGFYLYCNIPGADYDDVDLSVEKGVLHLRAEAFLEPVSGKIHALELCDIVYETRLRLTAAVDPERVEASLANGVLRITLPFLRKNTPVQIPVTRG